MIKVYSLKQYIFAIHLPASVLIALIIFKKPSFNPTSRLSYTISMYDPYAHKSRSLYPFEFLADVNYISQFSFCHFPQDRIIMNTSLFHKANSLNNTCELIEYGHNEVNMSTDHLLYRKAFLSNFNFYHLSNVYYNQQNVFCPNESVRFTIDIFGPRAFNESKVTRSYEHLLAISQRYHFYGDVQLGTLHRLIAVPKDIISKSVILLQNVNQIKQVEDVLQVMNVTSSLEAIDPFEYVYARNLYTILPIWYDGDGDEFPNGLHHAFGYPFMWEYAEMMRRHFNVTNVVPYQYALMNRPKGSWRHVKNFGKMLTKIQNVYPDKKFEIVSPIYPTLEETVRAAVIKKWLWCTVGSNVMNQIYMRPGTAVCLLMLNVFDAQSFGVLSSRNIWTVCYYDPSYDHFSKKHIKVNIPLVLKQVSRSFYMIDHQKHMPV